MAYLDEMMDKDDWKFVKGLVCITSVLVIAMLSLGLGFKAIDYHFPSRFDKLIHCNK